MATFMYFVTLLGGILGIVTASLHILGHLSANAWRRRNGMEPVGTKRIWIHIGIVVLLFMACAHYAEIVIG